ncbi:MAG: DUF1080 domain-containing protein [Pirellulales bacterium]|nr:DUF1080 domain-containing protein [Pirellulales bacterium]
MTHTLLRAGAGFLAAILLITPPVRADEPRGVKLMRPDSLDGWDHGAQMPRGWTISDGWLTGTHEATPLLSGFTAGAFRLEFAWSVTPGGAWRIHLPEVPRGDGLELILDESPRCGRLSDGGKVVQPGAPIGPARDGRHTAVLSREGNTLAVSIDGTRLHDVPVDNTRRFGLELSLATGRGALWDLRGSEPPGEPLFNGKTLDDWWCDGNLSAWRVEDGQIVLEPGGGNFLRTKKEYGNFTLSLEYQIKPGSNSGIGIRTPRAGWPSGDGMEIQFLDAPRGRLLDEHAALAIYGNVPALARADRSGQWNRVVVKADGWMISAWVNGELVQQFNTLHHPELKHRHLRGWIGPQDHGAWIRLRNPRILPAPDGTGLDAWLAPKPPTAATRMMDRLMNSESLSRADGVRSAVAGASFSDQEPKRRVLADLAGPGAVVRIARANNLGRLAFFFDGEDEPRIECRPSDLWKKVPPLTEDASPVLTYLPFAKSLRIELDGSAQGDYRMDYVTFPPDLAVQTFTTPRGSVPRGWLSAPLYRQHVIGWGVHREHDPAARIRSDPKTIAPGATETLARVDGAGVVRWVKLRAPAAALRNDDLWLAATVDGETEPAIAAPARYWFPGLAGGGNYNNFVLVQRDGAANLLAMPFGDGIAISATNRGQAPIDNVGIDLSVEQATEANRAEIAARPRLRGDFRRASEDSNVLFDCQGRGRWVGLVLAAPGAKPTPGVARLVVDGQPADGWPAATLDMFLGREGRGWRRAASGRSGGLAWRYLLLAPVDFAESLRLETTTATLPDRLVLYYQAK